jgi:hypothetical protein
MARIIRPRPNSCCSSAAAAQECEDLPAAAVVLAEIMVNSDASRLKLVLERQRIRVGDAHWVVRRSVLEQRRLLLDLQGPGNVSVELELPDSFDCRSGEHMAWLIGQIEEHLKSRDT